MLSAKPNNKRKYLVPGIRVFASKTTLLHFKVPDRRPNHKKKVGVETTELVSKAESPTLMKTSQISDFPQGNTPNLDASG